jgi:hypothetical protein
MLLTGSSASKVYLGSTAVSAVYLGTTAIYKSTPELTTYSTAGTFTYTIPSWCSYYDIVCLGGGQAGGVGSLLVTGQGGAAGSWYTTTVTRANFLSTTTLTVFIGAAQVGMVGTQQWNNPGKPGLAATVTGGFGTVSGAGGTGGNGGLNGGSPGNRTLNGVTYTGGVYPNAPGTGGGGGGLLGGAGGQGEIGRVWIRAY